MSSLSEQIRNDSRIAAWMRVLVYLLLGAATHMYVKTASMVAINVGISLLISIAVAFMIIYTRKARNKQYRLNSQMEAKLK